MSKFTIGQRVQYVSKDGTRDVIGYVTKLYPGTWNKDENGDKYLQEDAVEIEVTYKPDWWAYPDTNRFVPDESEVSAA